MDAALARHDALITSAVEARGGIVLKHKGEGDSTFSVFASASAAVAAATDAQRQLASEVWPDATPIVVRMGLHSGEAVQRGRDYYGQTVNRAARVRALAEGGQVLLSSVSASLVGAHLPDETELRFLRSELLRGIDRLEAIHELVDARRRVAPLSLAHDGADARSSTTDRLGAAHGLRRPRGPPSTHRGSARTGTRGHRANGVARGRARGWEVDDRSSSRSCRPRGGLDGVVRLVRRARDHAV